MLFCALESEGGVAVRAEFCAEFSEFSATIQVFSARAEFCARVGTLIASAIKKYVNRLRKNSVPSLKQITDFFK